MNRYGSVLYENREQKDEQSALFLSDKQGGAAGGGSAPVPEQGGCITNQDEEVQTRSSSRGGTLGFAVLTTLALCVVILSTVGSFSNSNKQSDHHAGAALVVSNPKLSSSAVMRTASPTPVPTVPPRGTDSPTTAEPTRPKPTNMPTVEVTFPRNYMVVAGNSVVEVCGTDLEECKAYLWNNYELGAKTPRRMICEFDEYGNLESDPTSIGGEDGSGNQQNDGLDAGFNKHWWNWNTIRAMNLICRKYWYYEQ